MEKGSIVIYLSDPLLYGKLVILGTEPDGRLLCEAIHPDKHGEYARELFIATELELVDRWIGAVA